jgi:hypothetical protein
MSLRAGVQRCDYSLKPLTHHDVLEFSDGQIVLLTDFFEHQEATVRAAYFATGDIQTLEIPFDSLVIDPGPAYGPVPRHLGHA